MLDVLVEHVNLFLENCEWQTLDASVCGNILLTNSWSQLPGFSFDHPVGSPGTNFTQNKKNLQETEMHVEKHFQSDPDSIPKPWGLKGTHPLLGQDSAPAQGLVVLFHVGNPQKSEPDSPDPWLMAAKVTWELTKKWGPNADRPHTQSALTAGSCGAEATSKQKLPEKKRQLVGTNFLVPGGLSCRIWTLSLLRIVVHQISFCQESGCQIPGCSWMHLIISVVTSRLC